MKPVDIHTFVNNLKQARCFTQKQSIVIENLFIYFNDLKVYKVIVFTNPDMSKKAKKLGFEQTIKTIIMDDIPIYIKDLNLAAGAASGHACNKGKFIAVYNPNTRDCTICTGEESEEEQIQKLKRPNIA